jgi:hypothetical protein
MVSSNPRPHNGSIPPAPNARSSGKTNFAPSVSIRLGVIVGEQHAWDASTYRSDHRVASDHLLSQREFLLTHLSLITRLSLLFTRE